MNKFRLIPNPDGRGYKLFINDVDVSEGTEALEFHFTLDAKSRRARCDFRMYGTLEVPENIDVEIVKEYKRVNANIRTV